jgi:BTB And C-terminal Kelch.
MELLVVSDKYIIPRLKNLTEQFISQRLSVKNIIDIINIADQHNALYLKECSINFMISNKEIICETQDISKLSKHVLVELVKRKLFK